MSKFKTDFRTKSERRVITEAKNTWLSTAYENVPAAGTALTVSSPELVAMDCAGELAETRLRVLTRDGLLKMNSIFDEGKFVEYVWVVR